MKFLQAVLRTLFYVVVGGVICIAGAAFFFMNWEPDRDDFPIRGIDVSHHQGDIDWAQVAGDDVSFVYMKASEGEGFKDPAFARNWAGAGAVGLPRGAYHYFNMCKPGAKQAANFLSVLPDDQDMLTPVVDLEISGDCDNQMAVAEVLGEISQFAAIVEQKVGKRVVFYAPADFYEAFLKGRGLNRRLWTRSIWHSPSYSKDWLVWQYHDSGTVKGIQGDVDLNVLNSEAGLKDLK
ncbi:MAG: glycoside hydrolase family 25 protein [Roseibium sp.]|uniref:glycoside hydrolase family 25 protein n=1 Tax=Roseibium sp. TaxID=1936156 RepID=UPI001B094DD2|nr:GH25 family lysozyme [Roseibium sp.]MBO6894336.1 glycoside hydrolase family 25 protein [Roseibium sp.]MBO6931910.1 glycoside hydrolase family 25 protein [Roseibium sp.]